MITLSTTNYGNVTAIGTSRSLPREQSSIHLLKQLIWIYFWFLLFEGALRKWIVPGLAAPLLVIRDPLLILIYAIALSANVFPKNKFVMLSFVLAGVSFIASVLATVSTEYENVFVTLYGVRTDFLHLPLLFLMPKILDIKDVERFGRWILLISIPMSILMVLQFKSGPYSFINATAGGEGRQLDSIAGKIRPPGTFSYITGVVQYYGFVVAYLLYGVFKEKAYSNVLLAGAGVSVVVAMAVSGSRSAVFALVLVALALVCCVILNRKMLKKSYRLAILVGICLALGFTRVFNEGMSATQKRFEYANKSENTLLRFIGEYQKPFELIADIPALGNGLGVGTNVGAAMLHRRGKFLLAEGEWSRIMLEGGPILGFAFILFRVILTFVIGRECFKNAKRGVYLPALLFGACGLLVLSGQLGQPTTLGFTVFGGGLCLSACVKPQRVYEQGALARSGAVL